MTRGDSGTSVPGAEPTIEGGPARSGSDVRFLIGALIAAAAIGYIVFSSLDSQTYYHTVDEVAANRAELVGSEFRLKGDVVPGSHYVREGTLNEHLFTLTNEGETLVVEFLGPLPDTFQDEAEVVALGRLVEPDRFVATEVIAKCPSKYEERPPTARGGAARS